MPSTYMNTDQPLGRCKNTNCSGEMRAILGHAGEMLTVAWTWRHTGYEVQAVRGGLPDWCPRCHPGRS